MGKLYRIKVGLKGAVRKVTASKKAAIEDNPKRRAPVVVLPGVTETVDIGQRIINQARGELGRREIPAGSNSGPNVTPKLKRCGCPDHNPWCCAAACCWVVDGGGKVPVMTAGCGTLRAAAIKAGVWTQTPKPGYIGIVAPDEHAVIVIDYDETRDVVHDISGNTSAADGRNCNGGEVAEHSHARLIFSGFVKTY